MSLTCIGNRYKENDSFTERGKKYIERFPQLGKLNPTELLVQLICSFKAILIFLKIYVFLLEHDKMVVNFIWKDKSIVK